MSSVPPAALGMIWSAAQPFSNGSPVCSLTPPATENRMDFSLFMFAFDSFASAGSYFGGFDAVHLDAVAKQVFDFAKEWFDPHAVRVILGKVIGIHDLDFPIPFDVLAWCRDDGRDLLGQAALTFRVILIDGRGGI